MTTISISQPTYLPWSGYFNLIQRSDYFVFLDDVQFEKQSWQTRNRLRDRSGTTFWLTVPIQKDKLDTSLNEIFIAKNPANWRTKHLKSIYSSLSHADFFDVVSDMINHIYTQDIVNLVELNIFIIKQIAFALDIQTNFYRSSDLKMSGNREEKLINICSEFNASTFYSNVGSKNYLDPAQPLFNKNNIAIQYQNWDHPVYKQGKLDFQSHLSILDMIAFLGVETTKNLLI